MPFPTAAPRVHPLHALFLAFPIGLFPAALASDIAYLNTAEMQWSNLSAWAITGALVMGAPALAWAVIDAVRRRAGAPIYPIALALAWVAGLFNAFQHSHDAWASVGTTGLILSLISTTAILIAGWVAFSGAAR